MRRRLIIGLLAPLALFLFVCCGYAEPPVAQGEIGADRWIEYEYLPGTATGREPLPGESTGWAVYVEEMPNQAELLKNELRISTGTDDRPMKGRLSYRYDLARSTDTLTLEILVRVLEQRGHHYAASVFLANEDEYINLQIGAEHVLLDGAEEWANIDMTRMRRLRITFDGRGEHTVVSVYVDDKADPIQTSNRFSGSVKTVCFGDSDSGDSLNGETAWQSIAWTTQSAFPPDSAGSVGSVDEGPSRIVAKSLDDPLAVIDVDRVRENPTSLQFIVDARGSVELRATPVTMPIEAGKEYWVNTSAIPPFLLVAEDDGHLVFELEDPRNCHVRIEPAEGSQYVVNGSFEELDSEMSPVGWDFRIDPAAIRPTLGMGHENVGSSAELGQTDPVKEPFAEVTSTMSREGERSLHVSKPGVGGEVQCRVSEAIELEEGADYLLEGFYHVAEADYGGSMLLGILLEGPDRKPKFVRDYYINPLRWTEAGHWRRTFESFRVPQGYTHGKVMITVRGSNVRAYWDDISLRRAPTSIPQYMKHTSPRDPEPRLTREEVLEIWRNREAWDVQMTQEGSQPIVTVDGERLPMLMFTAGAYDWLDRTSGTHAEFADAGVHFHTLPIYVGRPGEHGQYGPPIWLGRGQYDYKPVEEKILTLLQYDPQAKIRFYLYVNPYYSFGDDFPDSNWLNMRNRRSIGQKEDSRDADERGEYEAWNFSYTAEDYRRECTEMVRGLGEFLARSDAGKAVVGTHILGGSDGQWFPQHWPAHFDRSPGARRAFGEWLRERYNNDLEDFRQAWGQPDITFETVQIPAEAERTVEHFFLDPDVPADRRLIDANRFASVGVVETIDQLGRAFKEGIGRPVFTSTYYSDIFHNHGLAHWGIGQMLRGEGIDGVVAVMDYGGSRDIGRPGSFNALASSVRLHGKHFITEMDYRTDLSWLPPDAVKIRRDWGVPRGSEPLAWQIRRDLGMSMATGGGGWFYGLSGNAWASDAHMANIAEAANAIRAVTENPKPDHRGQFAVYCDERIEDYTTHRNIFGTVLAMVGHKIARQAFWSSGVTIDPYLLADLNHPDMAAYKVHVFLSSVTITPEQIEFVEKNLQKDGNLLVFVHAAGMAFGDGFEENIERLTGMRVRMDADEQVTYRYQLPGDADPLAVGMDRTASEMRGPLLYVDDPDATPLALMLGTDKVAAAYRRFDDWTSVYLAVPGGFTPRFVRNLAREAGIEPVGPEGDATYAGNGIIAIHAMKPGTKTLRWSQPADVYDLGTGKLISRQVRSLDIDMHALESRWFQLR